MRATGTRWVAGLAALACLAVFALAWVVREPGRGAVSDVASADAAAATAPSAAIKDEVRSAAAEAAEAAYSYSWKTLDDDKAAARALMTPTMRDRYDRTMAGVATASRRERTVVSGVVVDTALVTADSRDARVLVFLNRSTARAGLDVPTLDLDRVLVTLERIDGAWRLSELDAL